MDHDTAAQRLEALGSPHRLAIYRLLVQSGPAGMTVGKVQEEMGIPSSTLSHHLARLIGNGLVTQTRQGRTLICCCDYVAMASLLDYLTENCCNGECMPQMAGVR